MASAQSGAPSSNTNGTSGAGAGTGSGYAEAAGAMQYGGGGGGGAYQSYGEGGQAGHYGSQAAGAPGGQWGQTHHQAVPQDASGYGGYGGAQPAPVQPETRGPGSGGYAKRDIPTVCRIPPPASSQPPRCMAGWPPFLRFSSFSFQLDDNVLFCFVYRMDL